MTPGKIDGATRTLGAPVNWNAERDGECRPLEIRDSAVPGLEFMESAWYPTDEEKAAIAAGRPVILTVFSTRHPPVAVTVAP
jgi:hypothetical protein